MRPLVRFVLGVVAAGLGLAGLAALGRVAPGAPFVAVPLGVLIMFFGIRLFRTAGAVPEMHQGPAEDVAQLDVFFVCGECGTEFRVEKIGELQVPRHCGERMRVERRPRAAPELN